MGLANAVLTASQKAAGATTCVGQKPDGSIADTPARVAAFQASVSGPGRVIDKIRRGGAAARINNVYSNPPLIAPPAWATGTAYYKGQLVAANGNWYVCISNGTSAASGTGPSAVSVSGGGSINDNGVLWTYYGPAMISANDSFAPTVTQYSSDPYFGVGISPKTYPGSFAVYGAYASYFDGSNRLILNGFSNKAGAPGPAAGRRIEFFSDGANVCPMLAGSNAGSFCRIAVDQFDGKGLRFVTPGSFLLSSPYIKLAWGSARKRRYVVFFSAANYDVFGGVEVDNGATVWAPSRGDQTRAVLISDSTVAGSGYGPFLPGNDIANRMAMMLGIDDVWGFATGGTGELNPGAASYYKFGELISEALTLNPDLWLVIGSCNDKQSNGFTSSQLQAAVQSTLTAIRSGGSKAPIVRGGVWPIANAAELGTAESDIYAAYSSWAATDPYPHGWMPVSSAVPPVITQGYNNGSGALMSNVNQYLGGDGHPTDWGTAHEADRYAEGILAALAAY